MAQTNQVTGFTAAEAIKAPCRVATTENITLSGLQTINGVTVAEDDRVLVKDQTDATENGIYIAKSGAWQRAKDWNGSRDVVGGTIVWVAGGTTGETNYRVSGNGTKYPGMDEIAFVADAALPQNYNQGGTGATTRTIVQRLQDRVSVKDFGAAGDGSTNDTAAIQAAIDAVNASGGGVVYIPAGDYVLGASTLGESYDNNGSSRSSALACLTLRTGVFLVGDGVEETKLLPNDKNLSCIHHVSPVSGGILNLSIDSSWSSGDSETAGHGIFAIDESSDAATRVFRNVIYKNLRIENQAAYGIGLQGRADRENVVLDTIKVKNTGLDGIDFKHRGPNLQCDGCVVSNIEIEAPGQRLDNQSGIDVRGRWRLTNIHVHDVGVAAETHYGIRFRTYQTAAGNGPGAQADFSTLSNFLIECSGDGTGIGVTVGSANVSISNGQIIGGVEGVNLAGNADGSPNNVTIVGVSANDNTAYGFDVNGSVTGTTLVGCVAENSTTAGFRNNGTNTVFVGCTTNNTTTPYTGATASTENMSCLGCTFPGDNYLSQNSASDLVDLRAQGSDTDVDLRLVPKGAGNVRFGTRSAITTETLTGYITIKDAGGTERKIGVVS